MLVARQLLTFDAEGWARHDYADVYRKTRADLERYALEPLAESSLLVFGCGYNYPDVALFSASVREVAGVDVLGAYYRNGLRATLRAIPRNARRKSLAILGALCKRIHYRRYYRHLERLSGVAIDHAALHLETYDGTHLPWPDASFDVVISNAVLEHVADCEQVVADLARITRPGGISYHLWHNYYSYTGGHMPPALCEQAPWGHLRGIHHKRDLNHLTPQAIESAFGQRFELLDCFAVDVQHNKRGVDAAYQPDHAAALTPEIAAELRDYDRDLLLTRAYLLVARKPA